jgi:hypothetical protein
VLDRLARIDAERANLQPFEREMLRDTQDSL